MGMMKERVSFGVSITKNHSSLTELTERDRIGLVDLTELTKNDDIVYHCVGNQYIQTLVKVQGDK